MIKVLPPQKKKKNFSPKARTTWTLSPPPRTPQAIFLHQKEPSIEPTKKWTGCIQPTLSIENHTEPTYCNEQLIGTTRHALCLDVTWTTSEAFRPHQIQEFAIQKSKMSGLVKQLRARMGCRVVPSFVFAFVGTI